MTEDKEYSKALEGMADEVITQAVVFRAKSKHLQDVIEFIERLGDSYIVYRTVSRDKLYIKREKDEDNEATKTTSE